MAETAIDALKSSPTALALILLNVVFIGFSGYALTKLSEQHHAEITLLIDRCYAPQPAVSPRTFNPEGR